MFRTVSDLKKYLNSSQSTPEALAGQIDISNMTIRRLLKRPSATRLPAKYAVLLNHLVQGATKAGGTATVAPMGTIGFEKFLGDLERDGRGVSDLDELQGKTKTKLKERAVGSSLKDGIRTLLTAVSGRSISPTQRAICIGALAYFVNPFDLVPDAMPGVGFVDDFGVISLALSMLSDSPKK